MLEALKINIWTGEDRSEATKQESGDAQAVLLQKYRVPAKHYTQKKETKGRQLTVGKKKGGIIFS